VKFILEIAFAYDASRAIDEAEIAAGGVVA
jgi:hypothetical protein